MLPEQQAFAPPLTLRVHRVNGRRVRSAPVPLPEGGAVLGSEGLLGERLDASLHVARTHARILPLCGHWMLSLADEHMVCVVNGSKVPWGELCTLGAGDSVQMGFTELRVERGDTQGPWPGAQEYEMQSDMTVTQSGQPAVTEIVTEAVINTNTQSVRPDVAPPEADIFAPLPADPLVLRHMDEPGDPDSKNATGDVHDIYATLPPEMALIEQLNADFAASDTSRALGYQSSLLGHSSHWGQEGQALDAILSPPATPETLQCLLLTHAPNATQPIAASSRVPKDADAEYFARLAQPQPEAAHFPPAPNFSWSEGPAALDPLLLDTAQAQQSLEDIVDGPLHIDDVLRGLEQTALCNADMLVSPPAFASVADSAAAFAAAPLDVLEPEHPPDPLLLLDAAAGLCATPVRHQGDENLSLLLRREHHQADMHSPYTLRGSAQDRAASATSSPSPSPVPKTESS